MSARPKKIMRTLDRAMRKSNRDFEQRVFESALLFSRMCGGTGEPRKLTLWQRLTLRFRRKPVFEDDEEDYE